MENYKSGVKTPKFLSSGEQNSYSKSWGNKTIFLRTPIFLRKLQTNLS